MQKQAESVPSAEEVARKLFAAVESGACCASFDGHVIIAGECEYYEDRRVVRCCACGAEYPAIGEPGEVAS